jgi:hypothetical protein
MAEPLTANADNRPLAERVDDLARELAETRAAHRELAYRFDQLRRIVELLHQRNKRTSNTAGATR